MTVAYVAAGLVLFFISFFWYRVGKVSRLSSRWRGVPFYKKQVIYGRRPRVRAWSGFNAEVNGREFRVYAVGVPKTRKSKGAPVGVVIEFALGRETSHLVIHPARRNVLRAIWTAAKPYEVDLHRVESDGDDTALASWLAQPAVDELTRRYRCDVELVPAYSDEDESRPPVLVFRPPFLATSSEEFEAIKALGLILATSWDRGQNSIEFPAKTKRSTKAKFIEFGTNAAVLLSLVGLLLITPVLVQKATSVAAGTGSAPALSFRADPVCEGGKRQECRPVCVYSATYEVEDVSYKVREVRERYPDPDSCDERKYADTVYYRRDSPEKGSFVSNTSPIASDLTANISFVVIAIIIGVGSTFRRLRGKSVSFKHAQD